MPQILAHAIAESLAKTEDEAQAREAARTALALASEHGYTVTPEFVEEVCEHLKRIAESEPSENVRLRILLAERIICGAAEQVCDSPSDGDQSPSQ